MPFVSLTLADGGRGASIAPRLARAVAGELGLSPVDVIVSVVGGASAFDGDGPVSDPGAWPSAIIHGSPRPRPAMDAAAAAARALLAASFGLPEDRVWVAWSTG